MNPQAELMQDAFHALAQPVTALRTAMELALGDHAGEPALCQTLEDCLALLDRLMQDLAVFREIASLDQEPPLAPCDAQMLMRSCVEEMMPVAESCGVALALRADADHTRKIRCNGSMLQRAIFLLLDESIARAPQGSSIELELGWDRSEGRLQLRPGTLRGRRQQLCRKLIELAGASSLRFEAEQTLFTFRDATH